MINKQIKGRWMGTVGSRYSRTGGKGGRDGSCRKQVSTMEGRSCGNQLELREGGMGIARSNEKRRKEGWESWEEGMGISRMEGNEVGVLGSKHNSGERCTWIKGDEQNREKWG